MPLAASFTVVPFIGGLLAGMNTPSVSGFAGRADDYRCASLGLFRAPGKTALVFAQRPGAPARRRAPSSCHD
jgi:hypothetical protein